MVQASVAVGLLAWTHICWMVAVGLLAWTHIQASLAVALVASTPWVDRKTTAKPNCLEVNQRVRISAALCLQDISS